MNQATASTQKTDRVVSRITPDSKVLLERAASLAGFSSLNQFMVQSALREAKRIIEDERQISLSMEESLNFLQALENPPAPNAKLLDAAHLYRETVTSD